MFTHTDRHTCTVHSQCVCISVSLCYVQTHMHTLCICAPMHILTCHISSVRPSSVRSLSLYVCVLVFVCCVCGAQRCIKPIISAKYGSAGSHRTEGLSSNERLTKDVSPGFEKSVAAAPVREIWRHWCGESGDNEAARSHKHLWLGRGLGQDSLQRLILLY